MGLTLLRLQPTRKAQASATLAKNRIMLRILQPYKAPHNAAFAEEVSHMRAIVLCFATVKMSQRRVHT